MYTLFRIERAAFSIPRTALAIEPTPFDRSNRLFLALWTCTLVALVALGSLPHGKRRLA